MGALIRKDFDSRETLAETLAATIARKLGMAIATREAATLAVSGGSTPARMFAALARQPLEWNKVTVTLVDERFVAPVSLRSNEKLVRDTLLRGEAAHAHFVPLYSPLPSAVAAASAANAALASLALPLDVVVLGMGNDGHTASFFPDATGLDGLLDPRISRLVAPVEAPSAGEPRLTLTLPPIVSARFIALHIEGSEKRAAFEDALSAGSLLPIRRVIDAASKPVEVFWAP